MYVASHTPSVNYWSCHIHVFFSCCLSTELVCVIKRHEPGIKPNNHYTWKNTVIWINCAQISKCLLNFLVKWFFKQQPEACGVVNRMRHCCPTTSSSALQETSQDITITDLLLALPKECLETCLRAHSGIAEGPAMQITSAHWQLSCWYLLWYSTSSSFRNLREARPESIYILGSGKCHIGRECSQPR